MFFPLALTESSCGSESAQVLLICQPSFLSVCLSLFLSSELSLFGAVVGCPSVVEEWVLATGDAPRTAVRDAAVAIEDKSRRLKKRRRCEGGIMTAFEELPSAFFRCGSSVPP